MIEIKNLTIENISRIWGYDTLPVADDSAILSQTFPGLIEGMVPIMESAHCALTVPFAVIQKIERATTAQNIQLSFTAKQRIILLSDLLQKGLLYVPGKPFRNHIAEIFKVVKNVTVREVIVMCENSALIEELKTAYISINSKKFALHLIDLGSQTIESLSQ